MTHRATMAQDAREPDIDGHAEFDAHDPESNGGQSAACPPFTTNVSMDDGKAQVRLCPPYDFRKAP
jgi:hypothetical protein